MVYFLLAIVNVEIILLVERVTFGNTEVDFREQTERTQWALSL